jgi:aminoglycoside phosphotransferase (APT) family kinase protein
MTDPRPAHGAEQGAPKIEGIDIPRVTAWLAERTEIRAPLSFKLIAGGRSNMTFIVTDAAGTRFVLRRPPLGKLLPSAHDMAREHRLMSALADTPVPVPRMVGLCQDPAVNERDFYVMHWLDGVVVRDVEIGRGLSEDVRRRMSHALIDTLVRRCTGSTSTRWGLATSPSARATSSASSSAGPPSGNSRRRARSR